MLPDTPQTGPQRYGRGFLGLVAGDTAISRIDGQSGELLVRGYAVADLAGHASFEEVAWLVIHGELPTPTELEDFAAELRHWRTPPLAALQAVADLPEECPPLAAFRTGYAVAAALSQDAGDTSLEAQRARPTRVLAWTAALAAAAVRRIGGQPQVPPRPDLGYAAHLLWQMFGTEPDSVATRAFEVSLIVQAEHDIHAAALAALTVVSAGGDLDGAVLAGIGALSGSLHGGANITAFRALQQLAGPAAARQWVAERLAEKHRFAGFGHRVYKTHDPRGRVLAPHARQLLEATGNGALWETFDAMRDAIEQALGSRGVYANVDAFTGLVYYPLGLPIAAFTIPFCLAIQTGWMAHCLEYLPDGAPIRPESVYTGELPPTTTRRIRRPDLPGSA